MTVNVIEQLPLGGISAPASVTVLAVVVSVPEVPVQLVLGAGDAWMLRAAGKVVVKFDWVRSKASGLLKVMVSVEARFVATLAGENASVMVGATGFTVIGVGQALVAVPAEAGAFTVATPAALIETVPVSV